MAASDTFAPAGAIRLPRIQARVLIGAVLLVAGAAGFLVTPAPVAQRAVAEAGAELTQLLRMMALVKLLLVAGAVWLVDWRLHFPASKTLTAAYLAGLALAAAGPGLIWGMAHVALGAVLLHAGLILVGVAVWRDPGSPAMLRGRLFRR